MNMGWLREFLPDSSLNSVRVRNFEHCAENTSGTRIIDQEPTSDGQKLTVRLAPNASMSSDLVQMLNTPSVTITELSTKQQETHLEVRIR